MNSDTKQETTRNSAREPLTSSSEGRKINITADRIDSRDLFINTREITIAHGTDVYRLRLTAQNKLILTK
ncbi:MAG TPA: hemin uptake protein HemP [Xanthobacteraceae bacterium]|nr:hemin uptake protein HemP [Xanthobacteraceae bacterium]